MYLRGILSDRAALKEDKDSEVEVVMMMMQRSGADWTSVNTPWSLMWGGHASQWMLLLPFSHTDISVKKLSRLKRR